jgi:hypothetical protein
VSRADLDTEALLGAAAAQVSRFRAARGGAAQEAGRS